MTHAAPQTPIARLLCAALIFSLGLVNTAGGAQLRVQQTGTPLQAVIDAAGAGDEILIGPGVYTVNLRIDKPLHLKGEAGAVLDGAQRGHVVHIRAPQVTLSHLGIRNSGRNLTHMHAGVFVEKAARGVVIRDNKLQGNAFGIWLDGTPDATVSHNRVHGLPDVRSQDRGNGIHLFNVTGARIHANEIWETRDGIYIDTSNHNTLSNNDIHHLRYGIHYMYSYHNEVSGNRTRHTRTGYALMQSKYLRVINNRSEQDENYGILMNYIVGSEIAGNAIMGVKKGANPFAGGSGIVGAEGKAIFIYNAVQNRIHHNNFSGADIGIHLTAGSEDNTIYANRFDHNRTQVKYVATRPQEWSFEGRGNYWSDYLGWDLNADGIGDRLYEPNDGVDKLLWTYPQAKILMNSPSVQTLRWVQRQFPALRPQGVQDSYPLMQAPTTAVMP